MSPQARKTALEQWLLAHVELWRPQPFKQPWPPWCERYPHLAAAALSLSDDQVEALAADNSALLDWLRRFLPWVGPLAKLIVLPQAPRQTLPPVDIRLAYHVPARKLAQVTAFAAAMGRPRAPLLEWCAGLGHLGRQLAGLWGCEVTSVEIDTDLCQRGTRLARGLTQRFVCADALDPACHGLLRARHAVALHACGELHHRLIIAGSLESCPALDLAPCCYHLTHSELYRPLSGGALSLSRDDLRLAVTDTATASARQRQLSRQATAWKLAFQRIVQEASAASYHPLKPVPQAWLKAGFASWCQRLAAREGLRLPSGIDWEALRQWAEQQAARVRRLELVRLAFRRALELWVVSDLAAYLQNQGYRVHLWTFCAQKVTPRNILLSARLA